VLLANAAANEVATRITLAVGSPSGKN
jgi:hypothetical protein